MANRPTAFAYRVGPLAYGPPATVLIRGALPWLTYHSTEKRAMSIAAGVRLAAPTAADATQANADLSELAALSRQCGFDLAERLRSLENCGTVTFQVDRTATVRARDGAIQCRYKLADELLADLAALRVRARDVHCDVRYGDVDHSIRSLV
jgi:hypothetical protein